MKSTSSIRRSSPRAALLAASLMLLALPVSSAPQAPVPDAGGDQEIQQTVARVAYKNGPATYSRGDDPENWQELAVNVPLTLGDRVYTGKDARVELNIGGTRIFIAPETQLTALDLRDDVRQLSVGVGTATFRVRRLADGEIFEVDTPNVSVTFRKPGHYRVDVDADGNTRFVLHEGGALGVAAGGQVDLAQGDTMEVEGTDQPRYDLVATPAWDRWDRWVDERARPHKEIASAKYVSEEVVGIEDLDEDGSWEQIPDQGYAWTPRNVAVGWEPYREGRWMWQDPWGWSWVGAERWGWAPYHYGSWTNYRNRWFWLPVPRGERFVRYSPARVVFAGGPPGHGAWGGNVGWFPVGPREPFSPWWGHRPFVPPAPGFGFMNRGYMHAVRHDVFVGGGFVHNHMIRDAAVMRGLAGAPFLHGPLPFLPTQASIRMPMPPGMRGPMLRPPDAFLSRSVVTRLAPPLAPPGFSTKMGFIQQNHGMPVDRRVAERLSVDQHKGARPVADFRPASGMSGKVDFAAKRDFGAGHKVQPMSMGVPQGSSHAFATRDKPLGIQSKELQGYQRPYPDIQGQKGTGQGQGSSQTMSHTGTGTVGQGFNKQGGTKTFGQNQGQGQGQTGQQGSGQTTTAGGQGFNKQGGTKTFGQGQGQGQGQTGQQGSGQTTTAGGQGINKQGGTKTFGQNQGQAQSQGQGQHVTSKKIEGTTGQQGGSTSSGGLVKVQGQGSQGTKRIDTQSGNSQRTLGNQGQQSHTMSKKTEFGATGQQSSTRSVDRPVSRPVDRPADRPIVKQQSVQAQPIQKAAPVQKAPPPPPPPARQQAPPPRAPVKTDKKIG